MDRRDFLALSTFFTGVALTPSVFGKAIAADQLQDAIDVAVKKRLADAALAAATALAQSARFPKLTSANVSSVAGFTTPSFFPVLASHHWPSMYSWRF